MSFRKDFGKTSGGTPAQAEAEAFAAAIRRGNMPAVAQYLHEFSGRMDKARYKNGTTPLMCAAARGRADIAEMILDKGARVDAQNDTGDTALICAARNGHGGVVVGLLAHGADPDVKSGYGMTARDWAERRGHHGTSVMLKAEEECRAAEKAAARQRAMEEDVAAVYKGINEEMAVQRPIVFKKKGRRNHAK